MATDDLYKKLQVDPQAESEVIRAAYHALSRKYHPDAGGDLQRMVELNAAWAILGHPLTRSAYDAQREGRQASPAPIERAEPHVKPGRGRSDGVLRTRRDSSSTLDFGRYSGWSLE
jgi:DnaJ-class molecular chaperone